MSETDSDQKTEQPSQRKLTSARQRGQVIQSREVNNLFMLGTGAVIVLLLSPSLARRLTVTLARFLDPASLLSSDGVLWEAVWRLFGEIAGAFVLPLLLIVVAAAAGSVLQTGLVLATEKIGFDMERLSPIAGFKGETSDDGDPENAPRPVEVAISDDARLLPLSMRVSVAYLPLVVELTRPCDSGAACRW